MKPSTWTLILLALWAALIPAAAEAQIPLPTVATSHRTGGRQTKARRVKQLKAQLAALEAQYSAIKELAAWAGTTSMEMSKLYSGSLINLKQARAAIFKAQGKPVTPYKQPRGFEIKPVVAAMNYKQYSKRRYSTGVAVVPPDGFKLYTEVSFPDQWVKQRRRLRVAYSIFSERYLPMASRYQNTGKAAYHVSSSREKVTGRRTTFHARVAGHALLPGRYFVSCLVSTWPRTSTFLVSLGMFRVEGKLPSAVKVLLPHHRKWYRTYRSVLRVDQLKVKLGRGRAIQISGAFTRARFARGNKPVYFEAIAVKGLDRRVILRRYERLTRKQMKFGGRYFTIKDHGLPAGDYSLHLTLYTEYMSEGRYPYLRGGQATKSARLTVPAGGSR